jgi:signal transduction histidine kinase/ActR/RegA family two-component response regulator
MLDTRADGPVTVTSRSALDFVHRLLAKPAVEHPPLPELLAELAAAFAASGAGLASLPDAATLVRHPAAGQQTSDLAALLACAGTVAGATTLDRPAGGSYLVSAVPGAGGNWALWLEDERRTNWDESAALLELAGLALARWLRNSGGHAQPPRWADQLDRAVRQQRLETAAQVTRRLAHDFGNVLTGILGFSELALAQVPANTQLGSYLTEVYRGAQNGAQFTQQLRLFSRRQSNSSRSCALAAVLADEEARLAPLREKDGTWGLNISVPEGLPPLGLDAEHLRQVLAALIDNAREALVGPGSISVSAQALTLADADCHDLYGATRPGPHVEICIADTGPGLSPEAQHRLFAEPFFTTKPRRRGFGLAIAYGILQAHRGGLRLHSDGEHGVVARVLVPAAPASAPTPPAPEAAVAGTRKARGDRVLVVDDDPQVLQYVSTTLEQAGYRVQSFTNAEDALQSYFAQTTDLYRLVLSDVIMPRVTGIDLARRLLRRDPSARVLFMSGRVSADFTQQDFDGPPPELLPKPFLPEGLLRAVRSAIDRPAAPSKRLGPPAGGWGDQPLASSPR